MSCTRRTVLASALALPAFVHARAGAAHVVVVGGCFGGSCAHAFNGTNEVAFHARSEILMNNALVGDTVDDRL